MAWLQECGGTARRGQRRTIEPVLVPKVVWRVLRLARVAHEELVQRARLARRGDGAVRGHARGDRSRAEAVGVLADAIGQVALVVVGAECTVAVDPRVRLGDGLATADALPRQDQRLMHLSVGSER